MTHPSKIDGDTVTHTEWNNQAEEFRVKVTRFQRAGPLTFASSGWDKQIVGTLNPEGSYSAVLGIYATFEVDAGYTSGGIDNENLIRFIITNINNSGHASGNQSVVTRYVREHEDSGENWISKTIYSTFNDGDQDYETDNTEPRQCYFPCGATEYTIYIQACSINEDNGGFSGKSPKIRNIDAYVYWLDNCYLITEGIP